MTESELLEPYTAGERDFSGVKIDGAKLKNAELPGINLSGAILNPQFLGRFSCFSLNSS